MKHCCSFIFKHYLKFHSGVWCLKRPGFTRQTNASQLLLANSNWWCVWTTQQQDGKTLARIETNPICRQQFANMSLCRSHTAIWVCRHELANICLSCEGRFSKQHVNADTNLTWNQLSFDPPIESLCVDHNSSTIVKWNCSFSEGQLYVLVSVTTEVHTIFLAVSMCKESISRISYSSSRPCSRNIL